MPPKPQLNVDVFQMPTHVELSAVTTAGHYILASHLVRPLTKVDKLGAVKANLASTWEVSNDQRQWRLELADAQFSNGGRITSNDVVRSLEKQIRIGTAVHFPFTAIDKVEAQGPTTVLVRLKEPRSDFLYALSKPEFGVLHESDAQAAKGESKFKITSGPYSLVDHSGTTYSLRLNPHYRDDVHNEADLVMNSASGPSRLAQGTAQFFTTQQSLSPAEHRKLLAEHPNIVAARPNVGFSYWLSLNPLSPAFRSPGDRARLQLLVSQFESDLFDGYFWEKSNQLYLPGGEGRPSATEIKDAWKEIERVSPSGPRKQLRVLPLKADNAVTAALLGYLNEHYDVQVRKYSSEEELAKAISDGEFDLKISSNDFSSVDLFENLKTTFNASRPYVFLAPSSQIPSLMSAASRTEDAAAKGDLVKQIGLALLSEGLVAPIGFLRICFYMDSGLDVSDWSTVFPEISFWKARLMGHAVDSCTAFADSTLKAKRNGT